MTTLRSSVSFMFEEVLPLFSADTCSLIPLVGKLVTPPVIPYLFWIAFWTLGMIWENNWLSLSFSALTEMVAYLFIHQELCGYRFLSDIFPRLRVQTTLKIQSNGWHLRYQFHFNMHCCLIHNLLGHVLIYLFHLFLHVLCRDLCHWKVHLFCWHVIHG